MSTTVRVLLLAAVAIASCGGRTGGGTVTATPTLTPTQGAAQSASASPGPDDRTLRARAAEVVAALKAKDGAALGSLAHPSKGIRFSPYSFVNAQSDIVLDRAALAQAFASPKTYLWGYTDGKGDPMQWTFADYYARQLWKKDYSTATTISLDKRVGKGNSTDNAAQAYPSAHVVEYFLPGVTNELDWSALRVVLEPERGTWYVVGLVHDEWTI